MATDQFPYQDFVQNRVTMTPEKFGMIGSFCRSTLQAVPAEDHAYMFDQQLVRFTMQVMAGQTVTEHPEVTLTWYEFTTWRDHLKDAFGWWADEMEELWSGRRNTPPPWVIPLWPLFVLLPKAIRRWWPVKKTPKLARTTVDFKQSVLYPEFDHVPSEFGRPVIYETLEVQGIGTGIGLGRGTYDGRFMNKHEIISEYMRDPSSAQYDRGIAGPPIGFLTWLEQHGVNPDQLVKRR